MPAKLITVTWVCKTCGHVTRQPRVVGGVFHKCQGRMKPLVVLDKTEKEN